jgi:DNA-binding NtrC family response regulator
LSVVSHVTGRANLDRKSSRTKGLESAASTGQASPFHLLMVSSASSTAAIAERWANSNGGLTLTVAHNADKAQAHAAKTSPEVVLVDLLFEEGCGIALGLALARAAPGAEVVFVAETMDAPEVHAARDIGISRFVPTAELSGWLSLAAEPLARLARARRSFETAERAVSDLPCWEVEPTSAKVPLSLAEQRYRQSYLRATLVKAGGRRAAAELAGVPYTTFCVMLRKLGIAPEDDEA